MNPQRYYMVAVLLIGCILALVACGRHAPTEDHTAAWLEQGERLLSQAAVDALGADDWQRTWNMERSQARVDEERFPAWAHENYDACVYWEVPYTVKVFNEDRRPGNSAVFLDAPCTAWGWILVGERGVHFLELAYKWDETEGTVFLIEAWEAPADT